MARGRDPRPKSELTKVQRLAKENKELHQKLAKLEKAIELLEKTTCPSCAAPKRAPKDEPKAPKKKPDELDCPKCDGGIMKSLQFSKLGVEHIMHKCDNCPNRTLPKKVS